MYIWKLLCCLTGFFSAEATGLLFLHAKRKTVLLETVLAALLGAGMLVLLPNLWIIACVCLVCAVLGALFFFLEKRPLGDGLLAFCVSVAAGGLYAVFEKGMYEVCQANLPVWLYCMMFYLAFPLAFLLFPKLSMPEDWRLKFEKHSEETPNDEYEIRPKHLYLPAGAAAILMAAVLPLIPIQTIPAFAAQMVLALTVFWGFLWLMPLLVEYSSKKAMFTAEYEYRGEMNTFMNMVRSQRHDYNLHVQTVASLIRQKKWDECLKYVNALTADTTAMNSILPVKDSAIAALIDYYRSLAIQQKIRLDVDIRDDLSHVATNVYETNKIIGNLLQNAVDEMKQLKDRSSGIQLCIFKRGEFCMIRVSNRIAEPDAFQCRQESIFNQGYTTKCGHDGVGLSSIRVLANHVGGEVSAWVEGDTVHFIASIPELYVGAV